MEKKQFTDEQLELFNKLTALQKQIVLGKMAGLTDIDSYKQSEGKAKAIATMESSVSEILRNPKVLAFMDSINKSVLSNGILTKNELAERISKACDANVGQLFDIEADDDGLPVARLKKGLQTDDLKDVVEITVGKDGSVKFKMKNPQVAEKQLAELLGYNANKGIDLNTPNPLTAVTISSDDPQAAAEAYEKLIKGIG
ncbi:MAG: hypothetical protein HRU26_07025 [Psychroserpens sp.]|nr:hypothetical protein [Psychroserpens sp.]